MEVVVVLVVTVINQLCILLQAYPEFLITYQIVKPDSSSSEQMKS